MGFMATCFANLKGDQAKLDNGQKNDMITFSGDDLT